MRAACAGLTTFVTGTAFAAFPPLPTAEDLLVEHGIARDQAASLVKSVAGTASVRILSKDGLDKIIQGLDEETEKTTKNGDADTASRYNQMALIARKVKDKTQGEGAFLLPVARDGLNFLQTLKPEHAAIAQAECYLRPAEMPDIRTAIASFTSIPAEFIETDIVSQKDFYLAVVLHELAHCHRDNVAAGDARESRADLQSMKVMKDLSPHPDFVKNYTLLRILTPNFTTHNTGPFIDAASRGEPPVTYDQIPTLYEDLMQRHNEKIARMDMTATEGKPFFLAAARVFNAILNDRPSDLSPLTRRYMELFVEGAKTIAPKAAAAALAETARAPVPAQPAMH